MSLVRRRSLFEEINRIEEGEDEVVFELLEELNAEEIAAAGFRWNAASTQVYQDRILRDYEKYLQVMKLLPVECSNEEKDEIMFPTEHKKLYTQLRIFMLFVARYAHGRSITNVHISYRGLVKYRISMIFWAHRKHQERDLPVIPKTTLFNKLTEAMRSAAKKYQLTSFGDINRTSIGLPELRQLIDSDMISTPCIDVAEGHHLAWCIGRVCSVRPGSIAPSRYGKLEQKLYLTWRDISITRCGEKGKFKVLITFRSMKSHTTDPEKATIQDKGQEPLRCWVLPPQLTDNLIFSIPHRLLVIALRRGILAGISTIDELFDGDNLNISIKPAHLDEPVILASAPRGLKVTDKPAPSTTLSAYLQLLRGRRSGTDLARQIGADAARILMGHDPDSRTLEKYYLDVSSTTNISAVTLGESSTRDQATIERENAPLALNALGIEPVKQLQKAALGALVRQMIDSDENYPIGGSEREKKNYRRRVTKAASKVLLTDEHQKQRERITRLQFDDRVAAIQISSIIDAVKQQARELLFSNESDLDNNDDNIEEEAELDEDPEEDLDDIANNLKSTEVIRETDEPDCNNDIEEVEMPYHIEVKAFMEILLTNSLNAYENLANNPVKCPLCIEDDSVSEDLKNKTYTIKSHLNNHMVTAFHTGRAKFIRKVSQQHVEDNLWTCPYCSDTEDGWSHLNELIDHIEGSTEVKHGSHHDQLKREAGWYNVDWAKVTSARNIRDKAIRKRASLNHHNVEYSSHIELESSIALDLPGVSSGGIIDYSIPDRFQAAISFEQPDSNSEIPLWLQDIISFGTPEGAIELELPEELTNIISIDESFDPFALS